MGRRARVVASIAGIALIASSGVGAHTSVKVAEPAPAAEVRGTVDRVSLEFFGPVLEATIAVTGPSGQVPPTGDVRRPGPTVAVQEIEPLVDPGPHTVEIAWVAADGSRQQDAYQFDWLGPGDTGTGLLGPVIGSVAVACLVGALLLRRRNG